MHSPESGPAVGRANDRPDPRRTAAPVEGFDLDRLPAEHTFNPCDRIETADEDLDDRFDDPDDLDDLDDRFDELEDADDFDDLDDLGDLHDPGNADDRDEEDPSSFFAAAPPGSPWIAALRGDDPPLTPLEQLALIRDRFEALSPAGCSPVWVRLYGRRDPDSGRIDPEWAEMEGGFERLMGWTAPANCVAVGIIAGGNVRQLDGDAEVPAAGVDGHAAHSLPTSGRAHTVCILDREGRLSARTTFPDESAIEDAPGGGRLPDCLRRCFGLATAPPSAPSTQLLDRMWLGQVAAAASDGAVALSWEQVRRLHPVVDVLKAADVALTDEVVDMAMRIAPEAWTWEQIRAQAAEAGWGGSLVPAGLADWMDEGMFSRWVLEGTRPVEDLLETVLPWLAPSARRRLKRAVA